MRADGAIVAIDGWGNHHVDFVNVIEQLGIRGIPSVGLSYIGQQGRMVCTNNYVDCVVDFNKNASGYESCVVGDNNLTEYDAMKAVALLKNKLRKAGKYAPGDENTEAETRTLRRLTRKTFQIKEVKFGDVTKIEQGILTIRKGMEQSLIMQESRIKDMKVEILKPGERDMFVNSKSYLIVQEHRQLRIIFCTLMFSLKKAKAEQQKVLWRHTGRPTGSYRIYGRY